MSQFSIKKNNYSRIDEQPWLHQKIALFSVIFYSMICWGVSVRYMFYSRSQTSIGKKIHLSPCTMHPFYSLVRAQYVYARKNSIQLSVASKKAQFSRYCDTILCEYGAFLLTNCICCNFTYGCVAYRSSANAIGLRIIIHTYTLYYINAYKCKICIGNEDIRTSKLLRYFVCYYREEKKA